MPKRDDEQRDPKRNSETKKKAPAKMNPLAEYLIEESLREGSGPDAATQAQIDLLNAEDEEEAVEETTPEARTPAKNRKPTTKAPKARAKKKR